MTWKGLAVYVAFIIFMETHSSRNVESFLFESGCFVRDSMVSQRVVRRDFHTSPH